MTQVQVQVLDLFAETYLVASLDIIDGDKLL